MKTIEPAALVGAVVVGVVAAVALTCFALDRLWVSRHSVVVEGATSSAQQAAELTGAIGIHTAEELTLLRQQLAAQTVDRRALYVLDSLQSLFTFKPYKFKQADLRNAVAVAVRSDDQRGHDCQR